jgi:hypothetical protein
MAYLERDRERHRYFSFCWHSGIKIMCIMFSLPTAWDKLEMAVRELFFLWGVKLAGLVDMVGRYITCIFILPYSVPGLGVQILILYMEGVVYRGCFFGGLVLAS